MIWHFIAMLHMNLPVMVIWWHLAMGQSAHHSKPTFKPECVCVNCFYFTINSWPGSIRKTSMCLTVMVSPDTHKASRRTIMLCSYPGRVISYLLMLAGDVETNPGPGIYIIVHVLVCVRMTYDRTHCVRIHE